jgi:cohesin loading factor subunit SCC2
MTRFQHVHQQNPDDPRLSDSLPKFRRAMFTVGLLVRHFDFSKQQLYEGLPVSQFKDNNIFEFQWYFVSKIVLTFCEKNSH